jgi:hypothetical protein
MLHRSSLISTHYFPQSFGLDATGLLPLLETILEDIPDEFTHIHSSGLCFTLGWCIYFEYLDKDFYVGGGVPKIRGLIIFSDTMKVLLSRLRR